MIEIHPPIFVDSVHFIAMSRVKDEWRGPAMRAAAAMSPGQTFVTSYGIFAETLARFSRADSDVRIRVAQRLLALPREERYSVIAEGSELMRAAFDLYAGEFAHSTFSLQDCVAIQIMRKYEIESILTADQEFSRAGFTPLRRGYLN